MNTGAPAAPPPVTGVRASRPTSSTSVAATAALFVYCSEALFTPPTSPPTPFTLLMSTGNAGRIQTQCDAILRRPDLFVQSAPSSNFSSCWLALQPRNFYTCKLVWWGGGAFFFFHNTQPAIFFLLLVIEQLMENSAVQKTEMLFCRPTFRLFWQDAMRLRWRAGSEKKDSGWESVI